LFKQNEYKDGEVVVITPYAGQLQKIYDSLVKILIVQLSDEDNEEIAALNSMLESMTDVAPIVRKPLTQAVRIATVKVSSQSIFDDR